MYSNYAEISALVQTHMPYQPGGAMNNRLLRVLQVQNVVGGCNLAEKLTGSAVVQEDRKKFNGTKAHVSFGDCVDLPINATGLMFRPGSYQVVGAANNTCLCLIIHAFCARLRANGLNPTILWISYDNVVSTGSFPFCVNLEEVNNTLPNIITLLMPEKFPGMICVNPERIFITMFYTGKLTFLGVPNQRVQNMYYQLHAGASNHKMTEPQSATEKSRKRVARQQADTVKQNMDSGLQAKRARIQQTIENAVNDFLDSNQADKDSPDFQAKLNAFVEQRISGTYPGNKRRKLDEDDTEK
jgi:TATA-box binding protein (TBP) (component of TFIID and TFIIIB)